MPATNGYGFSIFTADGKEYPLKPVDNIDLLKISDDFPGEVDMTSLEAKNQMREGSVGSLSMPQTFSCTVRISFTDRQKKRRRRYLRKLRNKRANGTRPKAVRKDWLTEYFWRAANAATT